MAGKTIPLADFMPKEDAVRQDSSDELIAAKTASILAKLMPSQTAAVREPCPEDDAYRQRMWHLMESPVNKEAKA